MDQSNNRKKILLIVGMLIVLVVGITFSYFMNKVLSDKVNTKVDVETAVLNNATFNVEGTLEFNDLDILPGHKTVSGIKVTATGNNELIPYNLVWLGTNTLNTPLNYTVYKVSTSIDVSASCEHKQGKVGVDTIVYEECIINNLDKLGSSVSTGTIENNSTKEILAPDEFIVASPTGEEIYYYVILEYPNLDESQNIDIGGKFEGKVTVEKSEAEPDITILAAYIEGEDGTYTETKDLPTEGYTINTEKSVCSHNAKPSTYNGKLLIDNLTKSGTSCNLYYDKGSTINGLLGDLSGKIEKTSFTGIATSSDTGIYKAPDDYGTSYYFRGLEGSLNNWVRFADSYWRIIRVNGNGTVRMIYAGAASGNPSNANRTGTTTQINGATYMYNHTYNDNAYVGYMMGIPLVGIYNPTAINANTTSSHSSDYDNAHTNTYESDAKKQLDSWYSTNIENNENYSKHVYVNTGFCNDRQIDKTVHPSHTGDGYSTQNSGYAPWGKSVYIYWMENNSNSNTTMYK